MYEFRCSSPAHAARSRVRGWDDGVLVTDTRATRSRYKCGACGLLDEAPSVDEITHVRESMARIELEMLRLRNILVAAETMGLRGDDPVTPDVVAAADRGVTK